MIKTYVASIDAHGKETMIGWCAFGQVPIDLPPRMPSVPPEMQPQASPVMYMIRGQMYFILGYRWESQAFGTMDRDELPEAFLVLIVKEVTQARATGPALVRADASVMAQLPVIGKKG